MMKTRVALATLGFLATAMTPAIATEANQMASKAEARQAVIADSVPATLRASVDLIEIVMQEDGSAHIKCSGLVENVSILALRNVRLMVELLDDQDQPLQQLKVNPIEMIDSYKYYRFFVETEVPAPVSSRLRARLSSQKADEISWPQVTRWVKDGQIDLLQAWSVPVRDRIAEDERTRESELARLWLQVKPSDPYYAEAKKKLTDLTTPPATE